MLFPLPKAQVLAAIQARQNTDYLEIRESERVNFLAVYGPEVLARLHGEALLYNHWQANPQGWRRPQLRPDLVVRNSQGQVCLILDTKYKDLDPSSSAALTSTR